MSPVMKECLMAFVVWLLIDVFFRLSVYIYYTWLFGFNTTKVSYYAGHMIDYIDNKYTLQYFLLLSIAEILICIRHILLEVQ